MTSRLLTAELLPLSDPTSLTRYIFIQASPSCTDLSSMNTNKKKDAETKSVKEIAWVLKLLMDCMNSRVDGFLLENVEHDGLTRLLDKMQQDAIDRQDAIEPFGRHVCHFEDRGNPSVRKRQMCVRERAAKKLLPMSL